MKRQQLEPRSDVSQGGIIGGQIIFALQSEWFVVIEFDQQHRLGVVTTHRLHLVVQTAAIERSDQVVQAFTFYTDVWRQNVVTNLSKVEQVY